MKIGVIPIFVFSNCIFAQKKESYIELNNYSKWAITIGTVIYEKATLEQKSGQYTFNNFPTLSYNIGIEYDFFPTQKWSFISGIIVALEPAFNIECSFKSEDIFPQFKDGSLIRDKEYSINSFSIPLLSRLNIKAGEKLLFNILLGLKIKYLPEGYVGFGISFSNEDNTQIRQVFGLRAYSQQNSIQGSFIIGPGISYIFNKMYIKMNIQYSLNFQNLIEGEYLFDNLFVSERSYGAYKLSGNYIGLLFTINWRKIKSP